MAANDQGFRSTWDTDTSDDHREPPADKLVSPAGAGYVGIKFHEFNSTREVKFYKKLFEAVVAVKEDCDDAHRMEHSIHPRIQAHAPIALHLTTRDPGKIEKILGLFAAYYR